MNTSKRPHVKKTNRSDGGEAPAPCCNCRSCRASRDPAGPNRHAHTSHPHPLDDRGRRGNLDRDRGRDLCHGRVLESRRGCLVMTGRLRFGRPCLHEHNVIDAHLSVPRDGPGRQRLVWDVPSKRNVHFTVLQSLVSQLVVPFFASLVERN